MANQLPGPPPMDLGNLRAVAVLGRGSKGIVFRVLTPSSPEALALKAISRSSIERKNTADAYRRVWFERDVLLNLHHPLLPSLRGVVSTDKIVAFVIPHCSGGDLNALRWRQTEQMFSVDVIRFYAAELVLALEYLHGLGIVYRDLKPENVLIQENGHLMLIDFDLSTKLSVRSSEPVKLPTKKSDPHRPRDPPPSPPRRKKKRFALCFFCNSGVSPERSDSPKDSSSAGSKSTPVSSTSGKSNSFVGTEEYVAPEIIRGDGHDFAVDWWSLGIVLYEMLYGRTPFRGRNRNETFHRILMTEPELAGEKTPLRDLIRRLLEKDPEKRTSCDDIKRHEYFGGLDWKLVLQILRPPFIPVEADWEKEKTEENNPIDMEDFVQRIFDGVVNKKADEDAAREKSSDGEKEKRFKDSLQASDLSFF